MDCVINNWTASSKISSFCITHTLQKNMQANFSLRRHILYNNYGAFSIKPNFFWLATAIMLYSPWPISEYYQSLHLWSPLCRTEDTCNVNISAYSFYGIVIFGDRKCTRWNLVEREGIKVTYISQVGDAKM